MSKTNLGWDEGEITAITGIKDGPGYSGPHRTWDLILISSFGNDFLSLAPYA